MYSESMDDQANVTPVAQPTPPLTPEDGPVGVSSTQQISESSLDSTASTPNQPIISTTNQPDQTESVSTTQKPIDSTAQPESGTSNPHVNQENQNANIPDEKKPEESALVPGMTKPQKEVVLKEWNAASRPYKKHNRQFYSTIAVIALLIALILFFAGQTLPVAVVLAVAFLFYVLNSIPPGIVSHKITTYGIRVENTLYYWEELGRFWFTKKYGLDVLHIEVSRFPNRITLLLGDIPKEEMELNLSEVLLHETPLPTAYEKAAAWLHEKIPIDLES